MPSLPGPGCCVPRAGFPPPAAFPVRRCRQAGTLCLPACPPHCEAALPNDSAERMPAGALSAKLCNSLNKMGCSAASATTVTWRRRRQYLYSGFCAGHHQRRRQPAAIYRTIFPSPTSGPLVTRRESHHALHARLSALLPRTHAGFAPSGNPGEARASWVVGLPLPLCRQRHPPPAHTCARRAPASPAGSPGAGAGARACRGRRGGACSGARRQRHAAGEAGSRLRPRRVHEQAVQPRHVGRLLPAPQVQPRREPHGARPVRLPVTCPWCWASRGGSPASLLYHAPALPP